MADQDTRIRHSLSRKRNFIAKKLRIDLQFANKVHANKKDRDKQRKWRMEEDPEGDYDTVDDFLLKDKTSG